MLSVFLELIASCPMSTRNILVSTLRGGSWEVIESLLVLALQTKAMMFTSSVITNGLGESKKSEKSECILLT